MSTKMTTNAPKQVKAYFVWEDIGNCLKYYRTLPNRQLICNMDPEGWYTVLDDGCHYEPNSGIDIEKYVIDIVPAPTSDEDDGE